MIIDNIIQTSTYILPLFNVIVQIRCFFPIRNLDKFTIFISKKLKINLIILVHATKLNFPQTPLQLVDLVQNRTLEVPDPAADADANEF